MSNIKSIPFFFRRINDLEQLIPIINFCLKKRYNILLICLNDEFDFNRYKKFRRLRKLKNIRIDYFYNYLIEKKVFFKILYKLFFKINTLKIRFDKNIYQFQNIAQFVKRFNFSSAVFDFPISNQNYINYIKILKTLNIRIFGIHHSIWVREVDIKKKEIKKTFLKDKRISSVYDKILVFNDEYKKSLEKVGCKSKILFFGLLNEKDITFKKKEKPKKNKINILYLDHSKKFGIDKLKVVEDLKILKKDSLIKLTIRPNTSIEFIKNKSDLDIFYKNNLGSNIDYDETINLIKKSDIIINPISSVIIKAYLLNKIIVHPVHYIPKEVMIWQRYKSCFEVNSSKDIVKLVQKFRLNKLNTKNYFDNCNKMLNFLIQNKNINNKLKKILENII
tara:strand:+ start:1355 stop:2527 length:1173 start_codon:yes stop_codon:yes gene_type:complete